MKNSQVIRQRGDTIIEVLLAMSVIGVVLGSASGIANRSLVVGRTAQERTEALKLAESQLELVKIYAPETPSITNSPDQFLATGFCMITSEEDKAQESQGNPLCENLDSSGKPGGFYNVKISRQDNVYEVGVSWLRSGVAQSTDGNEGIETVYLYYRLGVL